MVRSSQLKWKSVALVVLSLGLAARAIADERPVSILHGTVELLSEQESIQPGRAIHLGLHFRLEKGWHIYWINPGDSGEPPRLEWRLPAGLRAGAIEWPAPSRLPIPPLMDYGYEGEVLLPMPIASTAGLAVGGEVVLSADMKAIVCREVCVPAKAQLSLSLPVRAERPRESAETAAMFSAARKALPKPAPANWRPSARDPGRQLRTPGEHGARGIRSLVRPARTPPNRGRRSAEKCNHGGRGASDTQEVRSVTEAG